MSWGILVDKHNTLACLFCDTSDVVFGPLVYKSKEQTASERINMFVAWLGVDPRSMSTVDLMNKYGEWYSMESSMDPQHYRLKLFAEAVIKADNDTTGTVAGANYALAGDLKGIFDAMRRDARRIVDRTIEPVDTSTKDNVEGG